MSIKKSAAALLLSAALMVQSPCIVFAQSDISINSDSSSTPTSEKYFESEYDKKNRGYYITQYTGTEKNVVIPSTIDGQPVTGIGKKVFKNKNIESIVIPDSVLWIGDSAFENCESLIEVSLSESVKSIGYSVFSGCSSLKEITIPSKIKHLSESLFEDCVSLESVYLPSKLDSIGYKAFSNCRSLKDIDIPNKVTFISNYAFSYCSSLTSLDLPASIEYIGDTVNGREALTFYGCDKLAAVNINGLNYKYYTEDGVLYAINLWDGNEVDGSSLIFYPPAKKDKEFTLPSVAHYPIRPLALDNCRYLQVINVEPGNTRYCSKDGVLFSKEMTMLVSYPRGRKDKEYTIPLGVVEISPHAFTNLKYLSSITISAGVTVLNQDENFTGSLKALNVDKRNDNFSSENGVLFDKDKTYLKIYPDAKKDKKYVIPNSVEYIDDSAFDNCSKLTSVVFPKSLKEIYDFAFLNCSALKSVTIPSGCDVGAYAFAFCSSLKSVKVNGWLSGESDFAYCTALTNVSLPGVKSIPKRTFIGCTSLKTINLGRNVERIGDEAFKDCTNLKKATMVFPADIGYNAFMNCPKAKIYRCYGSELWEEVFTSKTIKKIYGYPDD